MTKVCTKCHVELPLDAFGKYSKGRGGLQPRCKSCYNAGAREHFKARYASDPDYRARVLSDAAKWRAAHPDRMSASMKQWRERNSDRYTAALRSRDPAKVAACQAVAEAVRKGILLKPDRCSECRAEGTGRMIQAHHEDYGRPLDVIWLCPKCHRAKHPGINRPRRLKAAA